MNVLARLLSRSVSCLCGCGCVCSCMMIVWKMVWELENVVAAWLVACDFVVDLFLAI
jgi:hypothetical protein